MPMAWVPVVQAVVTAMFGPLQALHDGEMTGHHIDDGGRYEEGLSLRGRR